MKFGQRVKIRRVATQGRRNAVQWVTSYSLNYSSDGNTYNQYQTNKQQTVGIQCMEVHLIFSLPKSVLETFKVVLTFDSVDEILSVV